MESIITYVIIFGLLIVFTLIFLTKNENTKELLLTNSSFSFGNIKIFIIKQSKKVQYLEIYYKLSQQDKSDYLNIVIEMVLKDKTALLTIIPEQIINRITPNRIRLNYIDFQKLINAHTNQLQHFRIVITFAANKKLKSGILALNKNWNIYTPDTGTYN